MMLTMLVGIGDGFYNAAVVVVVIETMMGIQCLRVYDDFVA